jgi:hypothetical protein
MRSVGPRIIYVIHLFGDWSTVFLVNHGKKQGITFSKAKSGKSGKRGKSGISSIAAIAAISAKVAKVAKSS